MNPPNSRLRVAENITDLVGETPMLHLRRIPPAARLLPDPLRRALQDFPRQALHAARLGFRHPRTGEQLAFTTPPPPDLQALLGLLGLGEMGDV